MDDQMRGYAQHSARDSASFNAPQFVVLGNDLQSSGMSFQRIERMSHEIDIVCMLTQQFAPQLEETTSLLQEKLLQKADTINREERLVETFKP